MWSLKFSTVGGDFKDTNCSDEIRSDGPEEGHVVKFFKPIQTSFANTCKYTVGGCLGTSARS